MGAFRAFFITLAIFAVGAMALASVTPDERDRVSESVASPPQNANDTTSGNETTDDANESASVGGAGAEGDNGAGTDGEGAST